jgi:ubiquinone/menaquinone biosynthesis C-methylase UbiE
MNSTEDPKTRAATTYNAAADRYDDPANSFWGRFGKKTIERIELPRGARVMDVCCGSGASAIPAAEAVGDKGFVLGIDLQNLLTLARAKAAMRGLRNIEFRVSDMLAQKIAESPFDTVVCVFGIFFVPDMDGAVRTLWSHVEHRGKLAITTWGPRFFEPATTAFWDSIRSVRPELYKGFKPWDRISDSASLQQLFTDAGVDNVDIESERASHSIPSPEAWWAAVIGSGYRGTIELLTEEERKRVRTANLDYINRSGLTQVEANIIYAIATKT